MLVKEITYNITNLTNNVISIDNLIYLNPFGTITVSNEVYNKLTKLSYFKDLLNHTISVFKYEKEKLIINNTNNINNYTTNNIKTKKKRTVKRNNSTNNDTIVVENTVNE